MRLVSVIIATFNSSRILPKVLASLQRQTYPQSRMEILVVDGGSTDETRTIAKKFRCKVIVNTHVEPVYARFLGYRRAKGRYILFIDHDEEMIHADSISRKVKTFEENPQVKAVISSGYQSPDGYHAINRYINEFGDPFSFFMYRLTKRPYFFLRTMKHRYAVTKETKDYIVFDIFRKADVPIIELVAGASMIDAEFYKKKFPELDKHYVLMPHLVHLLRMSHSLIAVMNHDSIMHYSSDTLASYVQKIIWRVKNNIFYTNTIGASGFTGREVYEKEGISLKKYLFVPYALTLIFPVIDAVYLMITRKDASYAIHVPLTVITAVYILYFLILRAIGRRPELTSYDGSVRAYEKK